MESDLNVRFNKRYGRWTAGVNTPFKLYKSPKLHYKYYTNIKCPTLVLGADKTIYQDRILILLNRRRHQGLILHPHILESSSYNVTQKIRSRIMRSYFNNIFNIFGYCLLALEDFAYTNTHSGSSFVTTIFR